MAVSKSQLRIQLKAQGIATTKSQFIALHSSINKTGKGMAGMASQIAMATAAFYAVSRAMGAVLKIGGEFQQSMANVAAISKATDKEFTLKVIISE